METIKAVIALITMINELLGLIKKAQAANTVNWLSDMTKTMHELKSATTSEQRRTSAGKISKLLEGL